LVAEVVVGAGVDIAGAVDAVMFVPLVARTVVVLAVVKLVALCDVTGGAATVVVVASDAHAVALGFGAQTHGPNAPLAGQSKQFVSALLICRMQRLTQGDTTGGAPDSLF
jgi:hypothetical protein